MDKCHIAEVTSDFAAGGTLDLALRVCPVRMRRSQGELIAHEYNRLAGPDDYRVCIVNCWDQPVCCVDEDADISERQDVFVDVLGRGVEVRE